MIQLTSNNFYTEIKNGMCLVCFWSEYCGCCDKYIDELRKLDSKITNKNILKFATLCCDVEEKIEENYDIASYPTSILFIDGTPFDSLIGSISADDMKNFILSCMRRKKELEQIDDRQEQTDLLD